MEVAGNFTDVFGTQRDSEREDKAPSLPEAADYEIPDYESSLSFMILKRAWWALIVLSAIFVVVHPQTLESVFVYLYHFIRVLQGR
jgi:hypothetical protein